MDAESSLEAVALALSLILYALYSALDGYLLSGFQKGVTEEERDLHPKAHPLLRNSGLRSLIQIGLTAVAVAAGIALLDGLTSRWWGVALGTVALLVLLVLVRGVSAGVGIRWRSKTRRLLPLLWPLSLSAIPLSRLQTPIIAAFSRESPGVPDASDSSASPSAEYSETYDEAELEAHERRMITSILKLDETSVREIMVPRMDILAADTTSSLRQVAEMMWESGHSRIPLYEESIDNIVGVVHSRDMLRSLAAGDTEADLSGMVRPPLFIPESKRLDDLLRDFQEKHIQIALVVDEYGGIAGLVTIEDLLEEIVGEIEDEFNVGESTWEMVSDNEAVMDARISLEEVNQVFAVNLQGEGFDTLGGLLYQRMGKIPGPGDEVQVDGLTIRVMSTLGRRIKKVRVARTAAAESESR